MSAVSQVLAGIAGAVHVMIFVFESLLWMRPQTYRRFLVASQADARMLRDFAFNQGFYNLFLAIGTALGLVLLHTGSGPAGRTLVIFCCSCMVAASIVLIGTDRRMVRAALVQGLAPLLVLLLLF
jgi:putative membrane protein